jgi:hypothetical protein
MMIWRKYQKKSYKNTKKIIKIGTEEKLRAIPWKIMHSARKWETKRFDEGNSLVTIQIESAKKLVIFWMTPIFEFSGFRFNIPNIWISNRFLPIFGHRVWNCSIESTTCLIWNFVSILPDCTCWTWINN